jgi:hypothetical protein
MPPLGPRMLLPPQRATPWALHPRHRLKHQVVDRPPLRRQRMLIAVVTGMPIVTAAVGIQTVTGTGIETRTDMQQKDRLTAIGIGRGRFSPNAGASPVIYACECKSVMFLPCSHGTRPPLWLLPRSSQFCATAPKYCLLFYQGYPDIIVSRRLSVPNPYHKENIFLDMDKFPSLSGFDLLDFHMERIARRAGELDPGITINYSSDLTRRQTPSLGLVLLFGRLQSMDYQSPCAIHCRLGFVSFISSCRSCYKLWETDEL